MDPYMKQVPLALAPALSHMCDVHVAVRCTIYNNMLHSCGRMFNCNCAIREGVVMHASLECAYTATTTTECKSEPSPVSGGLSEPSKPPETRANGGSRL